MQEITLDLHTHLNEKKGKAEKFWKKVREAGLDGIGITEHVEYNPKEAYEKLLKTKPNDLILIPGAELNTNVGHVICLAKEPSLYEDRDLMKVGAEIRRIIEVAEQKGYLLVFAHPWGYDMDSVGYRMNRGKLRNLIRENKIGVETYNGQIGYLTYYVFDSGLVKVPIKMFDYFEKNTLLKRTPIKRVTGKIKNKIIKVREGLVRRAAYAIELGNDAKSITAGSDAHYPNKIGAGVIKIKINEPVNEASILNALKDKRNVSWTGPNLKEIKPGVYKKVEKTVTRKELLLGLKYATTRPVAKKIKGKIKIVPKKVGRIKEKIRVGKKLKNLKERLKRKRLDGRTEEIKRIIETGEAKSAREENTKSTKDEVAKEEKKEEKTGEFCNDAEHKS